MTEAEQVEFVKERRLARINNKQELTSLRRKNKNVTVKDLARELGMSELELIALINKEETK
jgi:hypothetical protein